MQGMDAARCVATRAKLRLLLSGVAALHARGAVVGVLSPATVRGWEADPGHEYEEDGPIEIVSAGDGARLAACARGGRWVVSPRCAAHSVSPASQDLPDTRSPPPIRASEEEEAALLYRAPETLLGEAAGRGADMWGAGCLFGALLLGGRPLFGGATSVLELLRLHCDCVGFGFEGADFTVRSHYDAEDDEDDEARGERPSLWTLLGGSHACVHAHDLLSRMLAPSARARISAEEALAHPFFAQCTCCQDSAVRAPAGALVPAAPAHSAADTQKVAVHLSMLGAFESWHCTGRSSCSEETSDDERSRASTKPSSPSVICDRGSTEHISHDALAGLWALVRERRAKRRSDEDESPCRGPEEDGVARDSKRRRCAEGAAGEPSGPWYGSAGVRLV